MLKFRKTDGNEACGTCLQDYMTASFDTLVAIFGEPTYDITDRDEKVNFEWVLTDGFDVVTIYNWKDYDGGRRAQSDDSYEWHIGGKSKIHALKLKSYISNKMNEVLA